MSLELCDVATAVFFIIVFLIFTMFWLCLAVYKIGVIDKRTENIERRLNIIEKFTIEDLLSHEDRYHKFDKSKK